MRRTCLGAFVFLLLAVSATTAHAQVPPTPTPYTGPMGEVSGTVRNGTAGASLPSLPIQLIAVPASGPVSSQTVQSTNGTFRLPAPADGTMTYVLRTEYEGVPYLTPVPALSRTQPAARADVTVWETTNQRPDLTIQQTVVSIDAIDPSRSLIQFRRDDHVVNPTDRVYVGDDQHRTLTIPAVDGVTTIDEQPNYDATAKLDGQTVVTTQPMRPGSNLVVTTMLTGFDASANSYAVRVTAPLPTAAMEVRGPAAHIRALVATANAVSGKSVDDAGEHWLVMQRPGPARAGEGMVVTVTGLAGGQPPNPLTTRYGAAAALAIALAAVVAGALLLGRVRHLSGLEAST